MITCNSCGRQVPVGASSCQFCGAFLVAAENVGSRGGIQEQPAIPSWLESLRANERPGEPAKGPVNFSMADLVDENALPSWMRPDSAELAKKSDSNKYPVVRPAWASAPNTDEGSMANTTLPPSGFSAGSLIDASSLPVWMRPEQVTPAAPSSPAAPLSAGSLVEPDSLPGWLTGRPTIPQSMQQSMQSRAMPFDNRPGQTSGAQADFASRATWQAPVEQGNRQDYRQDFRQDYANGDDRPGIAASSLLDVNTLPQWMRNDSPMSSMSSTPDQAGQRANNRLVPGSLIDMESLPAWLRSTDQPQQHRYPQVNQMSPTSGPYSIPAVGQVQRPDTMRVPNRPRAEMAPLEQSEVAANVFSSILGVSYNASSMPVGQPGTYAGTQQAFQPQASPQGQQYAPAPAPAPPAYAGPFTQHGEGGYLQAGQQGLQASNMPGEYGGYGGGNYGNGYVGTPQGAAPYQMPGSSPETMTSNTGAKPARRGFLETIREWFHF